MENKEPGRDKSGSRLLSLQQDGAAVRYSLAFACRHQAVFTALSGMAAITWCLLCTKHKELSGMCRIQDERQSYENAVEEMT